MEHCKRYLIKYLLKTDFTLKTVFFFQNRVRSYCPASGDISVFFQRSWYCFEDSGEQTAGDCENIPTYLLFMILYNNSTLGQVGQQSTTTNWNKPAATNYGRRQRTVRPLDEQNKQIFNRMCKVHGHIPTRHQHQWRTCTFRFGFSSADIPGTLIVIIHYYFLLLLFKQHKSTEQKRSVNKNWAKYLKYHYANGVPN